MGDATEVGEGSGLGSPETGGLSTAAPASARLSAGSFPAMRSLNSFCSLSCLILCATSFSSCSSSMSSLCLRASSGSMFGEGGSAVALTATVLGRSFSLPLSLCLLEALFLVFLVGLPCFSDEPRSGTRPCLMGLSPMGPSTRFIRSGGLSTTGPSTRFRRMRRAGLGTRLAWCWVSLDGSAKSYSSRMPGSSLMVSS